LFHDCDRSIARIFSRRLMRMPKRFDANRTCRSKTQVLVVVSMSCNETRCGMSNFVSLQLSSVLTVNRKFCRALLEFPALLCMCVSLLGSSRNVTREDRAIEAARTRRDIKCKRRVAYVIAARALARARIKNSTRAPLS